MDIINELAQYLDDAGFGTLGTDIFTGGIPSDTNGIYLIRSGGSMHKYDSLQETLVDVYVKNTSASTAITTLENIKKQIHRMHSTLTDNAYIYSMLVQGDAEDVARDDEYAKIYKISVLIINRSLDLIS